MKLIVCLDDKNGMMFNDRRQSRDRLLIENLEQYVGGETLYLMPYSEPLFINRQISYRVTEDPIADARDAYYFVETVDPVLYKEMITEIVIYRWNRHYPSDLWFTLDIDDYHLTESMDFVGSSHEKITREVWKK